MWLESGAFGRAIVPSGASTGKREAVELRDGDDKRYGGKGVRQRGAQRQRDDRARDRGHRGGRAGRDRPRAARAGRHAQQVGASAPTRILGVSLAVARAAADDAGLPLYQYLGGPGARILPVPLMNVLNGGAHADNGLDFQEFMLVPAGAELLLRGAADGRGDLPRAQELLKGKGLATGVGDEGGFAPALGAQRAPRSTCCCARWSGRLPARRGRVARARHRGERVRRASGRYRLRAARTVMSSRGDDRPATRA